MADKPRNRAGNYVTQPAGYKAFIPNDLPPNPPIDLDDEMLALLSEADRALGRLDGSTEVLPNPELFVYMYVRKEAVLSSQIEGTQASIIDVLEFEAKATQTGQARDVGEVVNYIAAMNHGMDLLKDLPVSLRLIRSIHEKLLEGTRGQGSTPGEFRHSQNWIGAPQTGITNAIYVPPPADVMMSALGDLEKFIHDESPMPFLIKVGIIHSQFETIHPFLDGNGRVGRLLIAFLLCEREILKKPLLYLSYYFKQNRVEYYDRLQAVRDRGDWEGWLKFFLRGVRDVAQEATETARQILSLREKHRELVSDIADRKTGTAMKFMEMLYYRPIVTIESVQEITGLAYPNASRLVARFVSLGILRETSGRQRNRVYAYADYLAFFADEETSDMPIAAMPSKEGN